MMDIPLNKKQQLWATAIEMMRIIGQKDGYDAIRGVIVDLKQVDSIARRVVLAVYPDPDFDVLVTASAFELSKLYVTSATACEFYTMAHDKAYCTINPTVSGDDNANSISV